MSQTPYIFDVTSANFEQLVLENSFHKPVLVDFWAEWCAPCKALMPLLAKITEEYQGELVLAKVNCDIEQEVVARFGVRSLPTVVLFKDGQPVDGFAGAQPESAIRAMLQPTCKLRRRRKPTDWKRPRHCSPRAVSAMRKRNSSSYWPTTTRTPPR